MKIVLDYHKMDRYIERKRERELLRIVKKHDDYKKIVYKSKKLSTIYHLSHVRTNILAWYDFKDNANILEIGGGYGEITGELCNKAKHVTSLETSKGRAKVIAERHKNRKNLEVIVGSIDDIEFQNKFDYIVLIGSLNFIQVFSDNNKTIEEFFDKIKILLKNDGIILLAAECQSKIENDHFFRKIDTYKAEKNLLKESELVDILRKIGFKHIYTYYPSPSYKFAKELCSINEKNSDSVLIEARNSERQEKIRNIKFATTRLDRFQIYTIITEDEKNKYVRKYPLDSKAMEHLNNMCENYYKLVNVYKGKFDVVGIRKFKNGVEFDFSKGELYQDFLLKLIDENKKSEFIEQLDRYYELLTSSAVMSDEYYKNPDFIKVYGKNACLSTGSSCMCTQLSNGDGNFDNYFIENNRLIMIDYEWIFDFQIPVKFQMWRSIHYFFSKTKAKKIVTPNQLYRRYGISEDEKELFKKMEKNFSYYVHGNPKINHIERLRLAPFQYKDVINAVKKRLYSYKKYCTKVKK